MGLLNTTIGFDGNRDVDLKMTTAALSGAWLIDDRWSVRCALGIVTDGSLTTDAGLTHDLEPGGLVAVGTEYRVQAGQGGVPTIDLSLSLGTSWAKTVAPGTGAKTDYSAADARLGARTGWLLGNNFYPYAAVRLFGGPVNWQLGGVDVTGSDKHHYQAALGAAVQGSLVGIFAEWSALGERGFSAGLSAAW